MIFTERRTSLLSFQRFQYFAWTLVWAYGRQRLQPVVHQVLVLPVAEIGRGFAERALHLVDDDADVDRIGGESPVIFERDLDADLAAVIGHFLERLDAVAAGTARCRRSSDSRPATGLGGGRMRGPPLFTRIDFAPRILRAVEPLLGDGDAGLALLGVELADVARSVVGDVLALRAGGAILSAILSSQRLPDALEGSNSCVTRVCVPTKTGTLTYMLSSATSPNRPEKRSMWVTPGKVSLVNCGKSSMVISPYFFFIVSAVRIAAEARAALEEVAQRPGIGGDAGELLLFGERPRGGGLRGEGEAGQAGGLEEITAIEVGHASSLLR